MTDDIELLRRYAKTNAQDAFAELVTQRLSIVYAVALRRVGGDVHSAKDVAQRVFTQLARQAPALCAHPALDGWLFKTTHYVAANYVRSETRRRRREKKALIMTELSHEEASIFDDRKVRLLLDEALMELGEKDREAVVLRFFSGLGFGELGDRLNLTEDGARCRVNRALEKLQSLLCKRGITSTSAVLGTALVTHATGAVPPGLAASISNAALAAAVGGSGTTFLTLLAMSKLKLAAATCAVVVGGGIWLLPLRNPEESDTRTLEAPQARQRGEGEVYGLYGRSSVPLTDTSLRSQLELRSLEQSRAASPESPATAENRMSREQIAKYDRYGDFFSQRGLSDEKSARLVELLIQRDEVRADLQTAVRLQQLDGGADGIDDLRRKLYRPITDEMEDILGTDGYREFREYEGTSAYRMAIVRPVSEVLQEAGVPISDTQSARLIALLAAHNQPVRRNSSDVTKEASIDWDAVSAKAAEFMSPSQMSVLEREFARRKLNQTKRLAPR